MTARSRLFLLFTIVMMASIAFGAPTIVNFDFGAVPIVCGQDYAYQAFGGDCNGPVVPQQDFNGTSNFGWTFIPNAGNGLTGPNTLFNPPPFTGLPFTQAAFIQGSNGALSQTIAGFAAGQVYELGFYLGSRYFENIISDGNQTIEALIDGNVIGTWAVVSFTPFTLENTTFSVSTTGNHALEFIGLDFGDHTAFLSDVTVTPTPEPSCLVLMATGLLRGIAKLYRR